MTETDGLYASVYREGYPKTAERFPIRFKHGIHSLAARVKFFKE